MRLSTLFAVTTSTLACSSVVSAFVPIAPRHPVGLGTSQTKLAAMPMEPSSLVETVSAVATTLSTQSSSLLTAAGPDWGIFEGRTGSLLHPVTMISLLGFTLYTAFLGFQYRRQRTIGDDIKAVKSTLPDLGEYKTIREALAAAKSEGAEAAYVANLEAALPVEEEVAALTQERKDLVASNPRDKHFSRGALIAFIGTAFAIEGPLNTYARAGKLFPGPHLYAGAGLVVLWALAVATVPSMIKGSDTARTIHIGANIGGIALFAWQLQSGIPILLKVLELTKWP